MVARTLQHKLNEWDMQIMAHDGNLAQVILPHEDDSASPGQQEPPNTITDSEVAYGHSLPDKESVALEFRVVDPKALSHTAEYLTHVLYV